MDRREQGQRDHRPPEMPCASSAGAFTSAFSGSSRLCCSGVSPDPGGEETAPQGRGSRAAPSQWKNGHPPRSWVLSARSRLPSSCARPSESARTTALHWAREGAEAPPMGGGCSLCPLDAPGGPSRQAQTQCPTAGTGGDENKQRVAEAAALWQGRPPSCARQGDAMPASREPLALSRPDPARPRSSYAAAAGLSEPRAPCRRWSS